MYHDLMVCQKGVVQFGVFLRFSLYHEGSFAALISVTLSNEKAVSKDRARAGEIWRLSSVSCFRHNSRNGAHASYLRCLVLGMR